MAMVFFSKVKNYYKLVHSIPNERKVIMKQSCPPSNDTFQINIESTNLEN